MINRRDFLLGSTAMAATFAVPGGAVLVGDELFPALPFGCAPKNYYCYVHPKIYAILSDGLLYWNGDNDLNSWEPVGKPFDKSPVLALTTLPNVAS